MMSYQWHAKTVKDNTLRKQIFPVFKDMFSTQIIYQIVAKHCHTKTNSIFLVVESMMDYRARDITQVGGAYKGVRSGEPNIKKLYFIFKRIYKYNEENLTFKSLLTVIKQKQFFFLVKRCIGCCCSLRVVSKKPLLLSLDLHVPKLYLNFSKKRLDVCRKFANKTKSKGFLYT